MKIKMMIPVLVTFTFATAACVTEPKTPKEAKPYVATLPAEEMPAPAKTSKGTAAKSDMVPGHLVIKCRIQNNKIGKQTLCGPTSIKLINEVSKHMVEQNFKGDRTVIAVARDGSYTVELTTKGCSENRVFSGLTSGMGFTAQFEDCGSR